MSAIRAPTPISALVHSSTLVVAGVFVIIRFSYCLVEYMCILELLSILTLFIRFLGLAFESDIKKLIAYRTINHVSLIIFLIAVGLYKVAFFHLNIHAIFKSMLFIGFGVVMLVSYHNQVSSLISLGYSSPIFKVLYYFSCLSLSGLPFLVGFFSKDFIIENVLRSGISILESLFLLVVLGASVYYSFKLLNLYSCIEYSYFNLNIYFLSLFLSVIVIVLFINYHVSNFLFLNYEIFSFKFLVYFIIFIVLLLLLIKVFKLLWPIYMLNLLVVDQILIVGRDYYIFESFIYLSFYSISSSFVGFFNRFKSVYILN